MQYWLMKSEPNVWSIQQQQKAGYKGITWDGVRNYQAANNLKKMKKKDLCFFYHSNIGKEIVGIVEVIKTAFSDITDKKKRFVAVQVRFKKMLKKPVTLEICIDAGNKPSLVSSTTLFVSVEYLINFPYGFPWAKLTYQYLPFGSTVIPWGPSISVGYEPTVILSFSSIFLPSNFNSDTVSSDSEATYK